MITINLLPIGAFKAKYKGRVFVVAYALFVVIAIAGLFSVKTNILDSNLENLQADISGKDAVLQSVSKQVGDATKVTGTTVQKWEQLEAFLELEERRRDQTRLLVEIEKLVPKESAWLQALRHNQGKLSIDGISIDQDTISIFLKRLENAQYIKKDTVMFVDMAHMVINGTKLFKFRIIGQTQFPEPKILEEGLPDNGLPSKGDFLKTLTEASPNLAKKLEESGSNTTTKKGI